MLAVGRYREDELFAGLRFTDSPRQSPRGMFRASIVGRQHRWLRRGLVH